MGAAALTATLALSATPAHADSVMGSGSSGGGIMGSATSPPGLTQPGPDPLLDPATRADFLSNCGDKCTITNGTFIDSPREGEPENVSGFHDTCNNTGSFAYKAEETTGDGLIVKMDLGFNKLASVLPNIDYSQINTKTTGITDTVNQDQPYTRYWLDKIPTTQKLRGNWHYEGDADKGLSARDFTDVEADVTYTAYRKQSRPMTEEEKVSLCGNASPS
ncbi:hypothetical protein [Streptomyces tubercidicus]|uniref:hypothetical protein n=1 Tax=Streptomyces tubercidicus TaxID=47759 RepID=UPI0036A50F90